MTCTPQAENTPEILALNLLMLSFYRSGVIPPLGYPAGFAGRGMVKF